MLKTITTTEMKLNTKSTIAEVASNPEVEVLLCTHNQPKAVLLNYERWFELTNALEKKDSLLDRFGDRAIAAKEYPDSAKYIRQQRDAEGK